MIKHYTVNIDMVDGTDCDYSFTLLFQAENKYTNAIKSNAVTYAGITATDDKKGDALIRCLVHIDGMINRNDETLEIYADIDGSEILEECTAKLIDENGKPIRTGTYAEVIIWAHRKGFIF